jgi:ribonuclease D
MSLPDHLRIDHPDQLPAVAAALAASQWVALDSESNSMFVYREQVCLIQINAGGEFFVIDPLAMGIVAGQTPSAVLDPLRAELERTDRPLYLHGGEYDAACLRRDFGIAMGGVWDTQQAASLLGWPKTGYGSLVEAMTGVVLGKAWATYDWATRPLHPEALAYAIDDVVYLPGVAETLKAAVAAADIEDEVDQANRVVAASCWNGGFDPLGMWRIRDVNALGPEGLRVLARLYAWRDRAAQAENLPAGRMINNEVLGLLARHPPASLADLRKSRLKSYIVDRYGPALLEAMALATHDPLPLRKEFARMSPEAQAREQRLKVWRREEAERRTKADGRTVPLQLVLPARALEHLTLEGAADLAAVPQLGARRMARYGDALLRLCG